MPLEVDRQTQAGRQTDRQTDTHTHTPHTHAHTHTHTNTHTHTQTHTHKRTHTFILICEPKQFQETRYALAFGQHVPGLKSERQCDVTFELYCKIIIYV